MQRLFLTRRNLLALLSKLDRAAKGDVTFCSIVKQDVLHSKYPCSQPFMVTAVEDAAYYTDRDPVPMVPADEPCIKRRGNV